MNMRERERDEGRRERQENQRVGFVRNVIQWKGVAEGGYREILRRRGFDNNELKRKWVLIKVLR